MLRRFLRERPQPPFFRVCPGPRISLPAPEPPDAFQRLLLQRRTVREFAAAPISLAVLSSLLFYTWGVTGFLRVPLLGKLPLKTSPSAGARHPIEVYVLALRVKGLPRGLYHYSPRYHRLERLRARAEGKRAAAYCAGQNWAGNAATLFLMTAVFGRSMWKYRIARAYRTVLADVGHLAQTLCLAATHLRLGAFCTMALKDSLIENDLRLNGYDEAPLYITGVGVPAIAREAVRKRR